MLLVSAILATMCGCKDRTVQPDAEDKFSTLPTDSIVGPSTPIDSKVLFSFSEYISSSERTTSLFFKTERIYNMGGYEIVGTVARNGNQISVILDSIQAPEAGIAILSPASLSSDLGVLPDDLYSMTISINGKTVAALMLLSDTSYTTKVQSNNLTATSCPVLLRVPRNIIWGQAESFTSTVYQSFLDSLITLGATPASLQAGYYGYFTVNSDGSDTIPSALGYPYGRHFLYQFNADTSLSLALVKTFAKRYQDSIYVELLGGRGEMYYSTVLQYEP